MKPIICLGDLTKMPSKERATQNQGIDANLEPYTLAYYHSSVMWAMLLFFGDGKPARSVYAVSKLPKLVIYEVGNYE